MTKLIAVYGTLKKGFGNHRVMGNSKLLGEHLTPRKFTMHSFGGFPGITTGGETKILCEIYEVNDPTTLERIYSLEGYSGIRDSERNWYDTLLIKTKWGEAEIFYFKDAAKLTGHPTVQSGIWQH